MKGKVLIWSAVFILTNLLFAPAAAANTNQVFAGKTLNIATVDNRPIYTDRLLYTAFKELGFQTTLTTAASLQAGYNLANNNERDGVIASTPDMEQMYPNLRKVPVALEKSNTQAFVRRGSNLQINDWSDLANHRVGILTQRVYIQNKIPAEAEIVSKETNSLLWDGLLNGEYDIVIYLHREHEILNLPHEIVSGNLIESRFDYLYLHKKHERLIPDVERSLNDLFADGRAEKILNNVPLPEMYPKKTVLHIISSSMESSRQDMFDARLKAHFENDASLEWLTTALDSKRFPYDPARLVYFANLLRQDCASRNIAAIVVSGEDALKFLKDYYFRFFKNTPVLFYGIGDNYAVEIQGYEKYFTGITENLSAADTVLAALKLFPATKTIYVANDYTPQGKRYREVIENQLKPFAANLRIDYNHNISRDALLEHITLLPRDSLVFVGSYFRDRNGQYFSANEMKRTLEVNCNVPIISLYSAEAVYNSIGGKCLDYGKYGEVIAGMLQRILNGETVGNIPVVTDSAVYNRWVFDKNIMDKFDIEESSLPPDALVINKKPTIWEANPALAFGMAALIVLGAAFGLFNQYYSRLENIRRKEHEKQRLRYEAELRQAALAAEESSHMKSVFLANMSHEIRTPMNSIIGFSELALDDSLPPKTKKHLENIKINSEWLLQIINDILDISKIESGKIELENIPFDMSEIFSSCKTIVAAKALEKNLMLYFYAEPSVNKKLLGDPTKLRQVMVNLVSNAVKFTNRGIVKVLSSFEKISEEDIVVYIEVKDSGIGMSETQLKKIFEPFMQADESTTRKYGGTGLGLPITKTLVELMGGKMKVESVPGIGSKFSLEIPFKTIDLNTGTACDEIIVNEIKKPIFAGEVLVCEDNEMNKQVVCEHLARVGLDTVVAVNGKQCVERVKSRMEKGEKPFALIFMDIHMPVMDGLEAAKALAEIGNKAPIVALTANIMPEDRATYRRYGMLDYLPKPFTSQALWHCLARHITPLNLKITNKSEQTEADEKLRQKLMANFVKDNQTTFQDITGAIDAGDIKLAYRLAHTLKSVAGLVGRPALQEAAKAVEHSLKNEKAEFSQEEMDVLEFELNAALNEIKALLNQPNQTRPKPAQTAAFDKAKALELMKNLELLLKSNNADCLDLIDELAAIPGTETLIEQIEEYDFVTARKTLDDIRRSWEAN